MSVTFAQIVQVVAKEAGIEPSAILGPDRRPCIAHQRQRAMWLGRRLTKHSHAVLGRILKRDHSTVIHGCKAVAKRINRDPIERETVTRLLIAAVAEGKRV